MALEQQACKRYYFCLFNDTAPTEIYTLSLHDALPIFPHACSVRLYIRTSTQIEGHFLGEIGKSAARTVGNGTPVEVAQLTRRSEEHTSELQSRQYLVCRLLLEKKNTHSHLLPHRLISVYT